MRISIPSIFQGSLGTLVQVVASGINALAVRLTGGTFADDVTRAAAAFFLGDIQVAVAAEYSKVQLLNPAGSGVFIYVDQVTVYTSTTQQLTLRTHGTALTTDVGAGTNKDIGGTAGVGHVRKAAGASAGTQVGIFDTIARTTTRWQFNPPVRLGAGEGVLFQCENANENLAAFYEWRELTT